MVASTMRISDDLKNLIETQQIKLEREIHEHHILFLKFQEDPTNLEVEKNLRDIQNVIHSIGIQQKLLIERIRNELKEFEKKLHSNGIKNAQHERTSDINNIINRSRKQNIISRCASDESLDIPSGSTSPEPPFNPVKLDDLSQSQFLKYFGLVTHDVHDEMQKKRVERKRRSTANPQFFYGSRGWDYPKRKRGVYLMSNLSPPNTRQSAKNRAKAERAATPPSKDNSRATSPVDPTRLPIPNLPVGLTIERVNPNRASPDTKVCVVCRLPGGTLTVCESCMNGFHVGCHNRPLVQPPRKCPKCLANKDVRTVGALTVPSGMSVSYVSTDVTEKLQEKQKLLDENKTLTAELTELQDRHSQLTISLKDQKTAQEELLVNQRSTEDKIKDILSFINSMKSTICPAVQSS
ncbi:hypothetical protein ILUMI_23007 [Ignelater luminosus]|uniref:Zinc finger PHD-type domain-containing protein n=1 Tax=Ignelater luminosus TaxID=2038154 RepID=A0A8K0G227_IGNLU|nr:hypothetical protein ILUMI_23007 [Ignelater luminosus]